MKECFRCKRTLPLTDFYKHPEMADGHLGKCKECNKQDVRANYEKRREQYLEYDRKRYRESAKRRAGIEASQQRHPDKDRARIRLRSAVAGGKIQKKPCEVCGNVKVDAHHDDYSKPLSVRWLCRKHHMEHHRTPHGCTGTAKSYRKPWLND